MDMETLAEKIKAVIGDMPVYLTFDIDALDPSAAPGTGTPVIGGPSAAQVRKLLYLLKGIHVVAAGFGRGAARRMIRVRLRRWQLQL